MVDNMDGAVGDGSSESQPQTGDQSGATAGSQNTGSANTQADKPVPFHQHPRWIERENQHKAQRLQDQQTITKLTQRIDAMEARSNAGQTTPEEERQLQTAAAALKRVLAADPDLKAWFESRTHLPKLIEGSQTVEGLAEAQKQAHLQASRDHVAALATEFGINVKDPKTGPETLTHVIHLVAGAAMRLPNGGQRYTAGDFRVLNEAFERVKPFLEALRKPGQAQIANTKTKTQGLPPRPAGSAAGPAAPPKLVPGKEKEYEANMHQQARALLEQM